jgi:hypothetical protein
MTSRLGAWEYHDIQIQADDTVTDYSSVGLTVRLEFYGWRIGCYGAIGDQW